MLQEFKKIESDLWISFTEFDNIANECYLHHDHDNWGLMNEIALEYFKAWSRVHRMIRNLGV